MHFSLNPLLPILTIKTIVYHWHHTQSPPKDFDFYDHVRSFFFVTLSTISTLKISRKRSIIKQKRKSGKIARVNIFLFNVCKNKQ